MKKTAETVVHDVHTSLNIVSVIPLSRTRGYENLSYFTAQEFPIGSIVSVPLRSKSILAIVADIKPATNLKIEIKKAPFEIKKLRRVHVTTFFPASFIESCKLLADYYATTIGSVIDSLTSDDLLSSSESIEPPINPDMKITFGKSMANQFSTSEIYAIQGDDFDRISSWRSVIRQEFARKKSVAIYVPTIEDSQNFLSALEKGIEGYIFFLHSGLSKKKIIDTWQKIAMAEHPLVIIATSSFALLPRADIEIVILERENARGWISQRAPYIDSRYALETIVRRQKRTLYIADSILRTETLYRLENHEIIEAFPLKWRSISSAKGALIDMRQYRSSDLADETSVKVWKGFKIISPELESLIQRNRDENTHIFIMAVRRGFASLTVCDDCETIVTCNNCSAPVVLHVSKESVDQPTISVKSKNFFMCHKCGERRNAQETCMYCGSWRLVPLGIGIDRVAEEIKTKFPDVEVIQIDADVTKTPAQIATALETFHSKPGTILLGTETALLHLRDKVEHVAIASLDSLFSLPDFRIHEKIMYTLVRMRSLAIRTMTIQTRRPEEKVFEYGLKGNLSDFYRQTLEERKRFGYPPFSILIKITVEGKKDVIVEEMTEIQEQLSPQEIDIFPAFTSTVRGKSVIHGLIKINRNLWPDHTLVGKLRGLPLSVKIKIQPENLL